MLNSHLTSGPGSGRFGLTVEVVPPAGPDARPVLDRLVTMGHLPFAGFSVATNPVAKPRMSALALCSLLQNATGKPTTMHCTTRDHNRLSIQSLLWGATALGIGRVLIATGDYVALGDRASTTTVHDVDVFDLVRLAREAGLATGVVLDPGPGASSLAHQARRLERKLAAGAQFVVTQPVYSEDSATKLWNATKHLGIPVFLGILPLRTARHAWFLHKSVSGITIPKYVLDRMDEAQNPTVEGTVGAREMLDVARTLFAGACIMPPFDRYEILHDLLA